MPHILTDAQIEQECRDLAANPPRYSWERGYYQGRYTWAEWHQAAVTALDCEDFSEYRWMCEQNAEDDDGETYENFGLSHPDAGRGFRVVSL